MTCQNCEGCSCQGVTVRPDPSQVSLGNLPWPEVAPSLAYRLLNREYGT